MRVNLIEVRIAAPDDATAMSLLLYESFAEYKTLYTDEGFTATTPSSEQILDRMDEGPIWVALVGDAMVGTVSVVSKDKGLYIRGMAVLPAARGKRIGQLLLSHIENYAVAHDVKRLFLSTTPFLEHAIRLYERFGFRRTDEGPHDLFGTPLFTMEKVLGV